MNSISSKCSNNGKFNLSPLMAAVVLSLGASVSACQDTSNATESAPIEVSPVKEAPKKPKVDHAKLAKEIAKKYIN